MRISDWSSDVCSSDLSGAEAYNQVLSERRANSVIEFLVGGGVDAARIVGRGLGETHPVVQTEAPEQRNRPVEIEFRPSQPDLFDWPLCVYSWKSRGSATSTEERRAGTCWVRACRSRWWREP